MTVALLISIVGFLWLMAITPGPNNTLLTTSGANFGFWRTMPFLVGIVCGMQLILLLMALGINKLLLMYPSIYTGLKVAGTVYLLWLSWKLFTAAYSGSEQKRLSLPLRFSQGMMLQFMNPKCWLMVLGALTNFSLPGDRFTISAMAISVALTGVNVVASIIWIGFGTLISQFLQSRRARQAFNGIMGCLMAACVLLVWE